MLTCAFSESSSNGKEAFWPVVYSWVWRGCIRWTNYKMIWVSRGDLWANRRRKGWAHSSLEVDEWSSCCVSATQQRAESWYQGNQARPHHCVCYRCICGIWTVCNAATSQWRDGQWIPDSTWKMFLPGWRKTTWKMDSLRICCWVATACQAAASGIGVTGHFDIRSTLYFSVAWVFDHPPTSTLRSIRACADRKLLWSQVRLLQWRLSRAHSQLQSSPHLSCLYAYILLPALQSRWLLVGDWVLTRFGIQSITPWLLGDFQLHCADTQVGRGFSVSSYNLCLSRSSQISCQLAH